MRRLYWWRLRQRLSQIKLLVLDVDGVLTDGGLWFDASGQLIKRFDARDGLGIRLLQQTGMEIAFLSGSHGEAADRRARQLEIQHCLLGIKDKLAALTELQHQLGVGVAETAFLGDDLNDLAVRPVVGLLLAPADACSAVRCRANAVLRRQGGHGAVRELAEAILKARGRWQGLKRNGWRDYDN
ncbi:phosphatase [Synechococcus sp. M16CYN]|uniref:KdsC family phosphatase n=1 Tax=Synechococcus sp. M16CYN TaxID=3103139 RepID=UPI00324D510C